MSRAPLTRTGPTSDASEAKTTETDDPTEIGDSEEASTSGPKPGRPNVRVARDARRRAAQEQGAFQLMHRLQAQADSAQWRDDATPAAPNEDPLNRVLGPAQEPGEGGKGKGEEGIKPDGPGKGPLPGIEGKGDSGKGESGKGEQTPTAPFSEQQQQYAANALDDEPMQSPDHPYVQQRNETRGRLERLGLTEPGDDRIHVNDVPGHGQMVTAVAAGRTSLIDGADVTLDLDGARPETIERLKTDADVARGEELEKVQDRIIDGTGTVDDLATLGGGELENMLFSRRAAINDIAAEVPEGEERKTFVNMSWGQSPERVANKMTSRVLHAPEGSRLHEQAVEVLGHPPKTNGTPEEMKAQFLKVKQELVYPAFDKVLQSDEHKARMDAGRDALAQEVAAARDKNILVFVAAGNEHDSAAESGRPDLTHTTMAGVEGLVRVGGTNIGQPGPDDDKVADLSNAGPVDVSAPAVGIPVGSNTPPGTPSKGVPATDVDGTSFAAPIATEVAYAMASANPDLSIDDIETLMKDPRAVRDLEGDRDGAGQIDEFAAVVLARNPALTRGQIDALRTALDSPDANADALKQQYGLN